MRKNNKNFEKKNFRDLAIVNKRNTLSIRKVFQGSRFLYHQGIYFFRGWFMHTLNRPRDCATPSPPGRRLARLENKCGQLGAPEAQAWAAFSFSPEVIHSTLYCPVTSCPAFYPVLLSRGDVPGMVARWSRWSLECVPVGR